MGERESEALQAGNGVLQKPLRNTVYTYDPEIEEQVERLKSENK